jgi:predicted metal-dependent peptidase
MSEVLPAPIMRARLQLMLNFSYLAAAVARLPVVNGDHLDWCDTMATDGYYIYVNRDYCAKLNEEEISFIFAHETLHCLLGHIDRRGQRERRLWNIAVDYATNLLLVESGMDMPREVLYNRRFLGMTAEEIFVQFVDEGEKRVSMAGKEAGMGEQQRAEGGFDRHLDPGDMEGQAHRAGEFPSAEERKRMRKVLAKSMQSQLPGREAGYWNSEIQAATQSTVPWQALLSRFFHGLQRSDYRLYPFNKKHIWRQLYLPTLGVPGPEHLVIAVDTSGSVDDELLSRFLGELDRLRSITECTLTLIQCDTKIHQIDVFEAFEESLFRSSGDKQYAFHGRGGTDLRPPFEWTDKNIQSGMVQADALIYLTDGFGAMPLKAPAYPALWVIPQNGLSQVPFGQIIRLEELVLA